MVRNKQIRVSVDSDLWQGFKLEGPEGESDSDTLSRLLNELETLRKTLGNLDIAAITELQAVRTVLLELHEYPLVALGMLLGRPGDQPLPAPPSLPAVEDGDAADDSAPIETYADNSSDF